jgi:hypothetical protein
MTDVEIIRDMIERLDRSAKLVSNMRKPRQDNNYGRAAQALADALPLLEKLPDGTH